MRQPTTQNLYKYWNEVRAGRLAPERMDIEPGRIGALLAETFILERADFETYRFRLAGTRVCDMVGSELRGTDFLAPWTADDRYDLERAMLTIGQQGGALRLDVVSSPHTPHRLAHFEVLVLPLVHGSGRVDRYMGCWCAIDPPSWLGAEAIVSHALIGHQIIWPDGRPYAVARQNQAPFLPEVRNARIVRSDRRQFRVYDGGLSKR